MIDGWKDLELRWNHCCSPEIPTVFGEEWSYYERVCKLIKYLDDTMHDVNLLSKSFEELEEYVKNYLANLDVKTEIDNIIQEMVTSGEFEILVKKFLMPFFNHLPVNVRDYNAKGDGISDDTEAINNARMVAKTYNRPLYFPEGKYKYSQSLLLWDECEIYGDGMYISLLIGSSDNSHLVSVDQSEYTETKNTTTGVYIHDISLNSNQYDSTTGGGHTIRALGAVNWIIEKVEVYNFGTYGIAFQSRRNDERPIYKGVSTNVRILNCHIHNGGKVGDGDGIDVKDGKLFYISNCLISNVEDGGIDLRCTDTVVNNCVIQRCKTGIRLRSDRTNGGSCECQVNDCRLILNKDNQIAVIGETLDSGQSAVFRVKIDGCYIRHENTITYACVFRNAGVTWGNIIFSNLSVEGNAFSIEGNNNFRGDIMISDVFCLANETNTCIYNELSKLVVKSCIANTASIFYKSNLPQGSALLVNSGCYISTPIEGNTPKILYPISS